MLNELLRLSYSLGGVIKVGFSVLVLVSMRLWTQHI